MRDRGFTVALVCIAAAFVVGWGAALLAVGPRVCPHDAERYEQALSHKCPQVKRDLRRVEEPIKGVVR